MKAPRFELLEVLIAAAESKNFYEAARKVGLSQPAVSVKLKELESLAPVAVFSLEGKRKVLTHYGRALYEISRKQFIRLEEDYENLNRSYAQAESLTLRVGCRQEVFESIASRLRFPGKIEFIQLSGHESLVRLLDNRVDIAITYEVPDSLEIISKKLFDSTCNFCIHKRWLKNKKLNLELVEDSEFLRSVPCVLYQRDGHLLRDWIAHLNLSLDHLKPAMIVEDWRVIQTLIEQGSGYGVLPSFISARSTEVESFPLPLSILPKLPYYALFHKSLRRIEAFQKTLQF